MDTETNSAHVAGFTCLAFSPDGKRAFTGGDDSIVRIWKVEDGSGQEPATAADAEGGITSISVSDDCWLSATQDGDVRRYLKDSGNFDGLVTDVKGIALRCVAIDPRGQTVAVASDEENVRLIDLNDTVKIKLLTEPKTGSRKATWHPTAALLTTCTSNGKIIVWNLSGDEPAQEAIISDIITSVKDTTQPSFHHDCSAIWHPSGEYFFVATRTHDIAQIQRSNWKKDATFIDHDVAAGPITALAMSPNGAYLASASSSTVHIWDTGTRRIIAKHSCGTETVAQLAFSPAENLIAWTTMGGKFTRWLKPIPSTRPDPVKPIPKSRGSEAPVADPTLDAIFGGDDNDNDKGDIEHEDLNVDNDDVGDEVGDDRSENDWMDDDTNTALAGPDFVKEMVSITKAQAPFQPGATPLLETKRLLAANRLGYIEVTAPPSTDHHLVDVKFFDQSKAKLAFRDEHKYHLGVLGERGALFACKPQNDEPALVHYRPYVKDNTVQWTYALPQNCIVLGIAAGGLPLQSGAKDVTDLDGFGNVVIATTHGDLTFLSGTGRERRIMGLGGDFVSMVAGHEWVFVVHRTGSTTIDGSQNLSYTLINFDDFSVRQRDFLPIPKGHILKWIGITEEGAPAMYDSTGRIHVLTKYRIPHHASWARILDTNLLERKAGKDESYWPFAICGSELLCFILKGQQTYPIHPLPPHSELPIEMPFRSENKSEEKLERDVLMLEILRDGLDDELTNEEISTTEQRVDKDLLILIQSACQKTNLSRAVELAKLIHNTRTLDSAIKLADFYRFAGLKEKFQTLKEIREEAEDRLVLAREKRKQWTRQDPLPRLLSAVATDSNASRPKPFQDFGPPPSMPRPGLAPAIPVKETTRYTANASIDLRSTPVESSSRSPPENKRKRDEVEEVEEASTSFEFVAPPPKQKTNPFARKAGQENGRNNPFARKAEFKTLQKSESFFDKVDAAEEVAPKSKRPAASKAKDKEKKDGPRQVTLFGMMSSAPRTQKEKPRVASVAPADSDVAMTDADLVETQPDLPEEWEETQPVGGDLLEETQPVTP
ncbi:Chromosome segregation protein [Mycena venus]|uniref:Chromosome segregation protein n=1 Tax=Mycena venus TaxID=2733690 RepID=A0A8H7D595_9AGAR|nr:Chromosome segregation protein [Mycena venus]